jgi:hypothetical protein
VRYFLAVIRIGVFPVSDNITDIMLTMKWVSVSPKRILGPLSESEQYKSLLTPRFFLHSIAAALRSAVRVLAMALSPLRRIVVRELCESQPDPRNPKYLVYSILDHLECGHSQNNYLFDGLLDLINPYTDSPVIRAKRHRCRPCAQLLAQKKPVQGVPFPAIRKVA